MIRQFAMKLKKPVVTVCHHKEFCHFFDIAWWWDVWHNNNCARGGITRTADEAVLQFANLHDGRRWGLDWRFCGVVGNSAQPSNWRVWVSQRVCSKNIEKTHNLSGCHLFFVVIIHVFGFSPETMLLEACLDWRMTQVRGWHRTRMVFDQRFSSIQ